LFGTHLYSYSCNLEIFGDRINHRHCYSIIIGINSFFHKNKTLSSLHITNTTTMATRVASSTATASFTKPQTHHIAAAAATASTTRHHSSASRQVPNRFTQAFQEMKEVCPNSISLYASCVLEAERSGQAIEKHSCSNEFRQVKDCFRKVRGF